MKKTVLVLGALSLCEATGCRRSEARSQSHEARAVPVTSAAHAQLPAVAPVSDEEVRLAANSSHTRREGAWGSTYVPEDWSTSAEGGAPPVGNAALAAAWSTMQGGIADTKESVAVFISPRPDATQSVVALAQSATIPAGWVADAAAPFSDPSVQGFDVARRRLHVRHTIWPRVGWLEARARGARVYWIVCVATPIGAEEESACEPISRRFRPPIDG